MNLAFLVHNCVFEGDLTFLLFLSMYFGLKLGLFSSQLCFWGGISLVFFFVIEGVFLDRNRVVWIETLLVYSSQLIILFYSTHQVPHLRPLGVIEGYPALIVRMFGPRHSYCPRHLEKAALTASLYNLLFCPFHLNEENINQLNHECIINKIKSRVR